MTLGRTTPELDNPFGKVTKPDLLRLPRDFATASGMGARLSRGHPVRPSCSHSPVARWCGTRSRNPIRRAESP
ncbi:hypothetical protein GCM10018966_098080 [Streptomyces yanii]